MKRLREYQLTTAAKKAHVTVRRRKGESTESLFKRFRKKHSKSGLIREVKEKMYFEKPSDKRRRKRAQAIRALKKEEEKRKEQEEYYQKRFKKGRKKHERTKRTSSRKQNYRKGLETKTGRNEREDSSS